MFDIIGFWLAVSTMVGIFILGLWWIPVKLIDFLIYKVTNGDYEGLLYNKLKWSTWGKLGWVDKNGTTYDRVFCITILFFFADALLCAGMSNSYTLYGTLPYESIAIFATKTTPFFSYISMFVLAWIVFLYTGRFLYKMSKAIKKLQDKVGE